VTKCPGQSEVTVTWHILSVTVKKDLEKKKNNNFREHLSKFFEKTRSPRPMLRCLQADAGRPDKGTTRHASLNQASKLPIDLEGN